MPTAYSYARFSSDRQHESSIEAQQDATRKWAEAHGVTIVHEYCDRGISGTTDERPEFQKMIAACRIRKVDFVLVHKHDRFARNRYDAVIYGRIIEQTGARLVAVAQDFGETPEAVIMEGLMQAWSEYYSRNLSTETKKGLRVRAMKGLSLGGFVPFGYQLAEDGSMEIADDEAIWVRAFFDAYLSGGFQDAVRRANMAGVRGRKGVRLTPHGVMKMIRNPVYRGAYRVTVGGEETLIEDHHPAIVSPEIWKEAKTIMEARIKVRSEEDKTYLLTGMVRCGICGKRIRAQTQLHGGKEYVYYGCRESGSHPDGKALRSIQAAALDDAARQYVRAILTPEARQAAAAALAEYIDGRKKDAKQRGPDAKKRIRALEKKIDSIVENMSSGVLPPSVLKRLGEQVTELETEIEAQRELMNAPPDPDMPSIEEFFAGAAAIDENMPIDEQQRIIRRFISVITLTNDEIAIESTFADWLKDRGITIYTKKPLPDPARILGINLARQSLSAPSLFDIMIINLCKLRKAA